MLHLEARSLADKPLSLGSHVYTRPSGPAQGPRPDPRPARGATWPNAQARPKAQAWPSPGQIWKFGDLEIQKFGIQNIRKMKIIKIQIHSAQNVGKVWISREKILLAPFGCISGIFRWDRKVQSIFKETAYSLVGPCCYTPLVGAIGSV